MRVLLEAQLEGLAHSADDAPGKAPAALQDVAGWGVDLLCSISVAWLADTLQPTVPHPHCRASPLWLMGSLAT